MPAAINALLLYEIGRRKIGPDLGLFAAVAAAFYGPLIFFDAEMLAPVLVIFFYLLMALSLDRAITGHRLVWWPVAGVWLGLAALLPVMQAQGTGGALAQVADDAVPVGEYQLEDLRRRVVVLEQSPVIVSGTVWENLTYGVQNPEETQVLHAAQQAGVADFISRQPLGYQTILGDRGAGVSSGEAQRIAIARLLQGNPLIVVLDEATNAVDRTGREALEALVDRCFHDRTRIIIAHADERVTDDMTVVLGPPRQDRGS